jgi:GT2 family glycosyltransferase
VLLSAAVAYLLTLLIAAARARRRSPAPPTTVDDATSFVVLIPAHDEEESLPATLRSVSELAYPPDRWSVVVVADNCRDRTADIAREAGVTVLERHDTTRAGKGHALAWAFEQLRAPAERADAIVVVDADCQVSANLLAAADGRLRSGADALQVDNVVSNPDESRSSALRFAAFALINTVRPLGRSRLGFSCGLLGTGMVFSMALLARQPWRAGSVAEDAEYHLQLVMAGERVLFVPEARVSSTMPTSSRDARDQNLRWESGRWELVRRWSARLLGKALRDRDPAAAVAGIDLLMPPQSLLLAANACALGTARVRRTGVRLAVLSLLGQSLYVFGGLWLVRAPIAVYRAMLTAPALAIWKLALHARLLAGRRPTGWIRTVRPATSPSAQTSPDGGAAARAVVACE